MPPAEEPYGCDDGVYVIAVAPEELEASRASSLQRNAYADTTAAQAQAQAQTPALAPAANRHAKAPAAKAPAAKAKKADAKADAGEKGKKKVSPGAVVLDVLLAIIIVLVVLVVIFSVCFEGVYIVGSSMNPTFTGAEDTTTVGGDYVYANVYRKPTYGDVVIIQETEEKIIIKRVIAMEGDSVKMERGTVYVQYAGTEEYVALTEDYVDPGNNNANLAINTQAAHTVLDGCIYCLGDNRNVSNDSRQNGDFTLDSVLGVVPQWAISIKDFTTSVYNFFHFG